MNKNSDAYENYKQMLEQATNEINQRSSLETTRKGMAGFRDKFTYYKVAIFFAYGYINIIQTMIIFLGVTPEAIKNINNFLKILRFPYQFPVDIASFLAIVIIISLFAFGIFAMLIFGLYKREMEIGTVQHPGFFLLSQQNDKIIELLSQEKK